MPGDYKNYIDNGDMGREKCVSESGQFSSRDVRIASLTKPRGTRRLCVCNRPFTDGDLQSGSC